MEIGDSSKQIRWHHARNGAGKSSIEEGLLTTAAELLNLELSWIPPRQTEQGDRHPAAHGVAATGLSESTSALSLS